MEALRSERLVERVRDRGPGLRDELSSALSGIPLVREVRGHGYLLGVEYVDPRDERSFLPPELRVAGRIDEVAFHNGLITLSTQPTRDGYAGDQTLFAPPFTTSDDELAEMIARFAGTVRRVAEEVEPELSQAGTPSPSPSEILG
jgi:adenosylmethionine-8-amino-7-oxononanoate aminotransferase